jgi:hypothetical protein
MMVSNISGADLMYMAILDRIYTLNASRTAITSVQDASAYTAQRFGRIIEGVTTAGVRFLLACGSNAAAGSSSTYYRSTDGSSWTDATSLPSTPADPEPANFSDMIYWNGLIIGHAEGDQIIGSADGIAWDVDSAGALDPRWRTGDIEVQFIGVAMAPWGANAVYFISKGKLWILDWYVYNAVEVQDVGDSNWLEQGVVWNGSVFVSDGWSIWEYNPGNAQTVRKIGLFGKDGGPPSWTGNVAAAGAQIGGDDYQFNKFIPGTSDLFGVARSLTSPRTWRLMVYNGVGWSWLGSEVSASQPYSALVDRFPLSVSATEATRFIDVMALDDQPVDGNADFTLHTYELPRSGDAPVSGGRQHFETGPLSFETGWFDGGFMELEGAVLRMAIDGYNIDENQTIQVEYRLNNNENASYINLGTYTNNQQEIWFAEDHRGVAFKSIQFRVTLTRTIGTLWEDSGFNIGEALDDSETGIDTADDIEDMGLMIGDIIRIDDEQMLITAFTFAGTDVLTVTRAYNNTTAAAHDNAKDIYTELPETPELKALVLLYDKVPHIRTAWTVRIDVSRTVARRMLLNPDEEMSTERIWQFLKSLVNTPTLTKMDIPSMESGGINVRITDMPATIDEFRDAKGGRGFIELQLVEPAGP